MMVNNDFCFSDTMGNSGAFIILNGRDMIPKYTTYEAVVSFIIIKTHVNCGILKHGF